MSTGIPLPSEHAVDTENIVCRLKATRLESRSFLQDGDFESCLALRHEQRQLAERLTSATDWKKATQGQDWLAGAHCGIALCLSMIGRHDEAEEHFRLSVSIRSDLSISDRNVRQRLADTFRLWGEARLRSTRHGDHRSIRLFQRSICSHQRCNAEGNAAPWHYVTAVSFYAKALLNCGKRDEAGRVAVDAVRDLMSLPPEERARCDSDSVNVLISISKEFRLHRTEPKEKRLFADGRVLISRSQCLVTSLEILIVLLLFYLAISYGTLQYVLFATVNLCIRQRNNTGRNLTPVVLVSSAQTLASFFLPPLMCFLPLVGSFIPIGILVRRMERSHLRRMLVDHRLRIEWMEIVVDDTAESIIERFEKWARKLMLDFQTGRYVPKCRESLVVLLAYGSSLIELLSTSEWHDIKEDSRPANPKPSVIRERIRQRPPPICLFSWPQLFARRQTLADPIPA